jgi:thermosome
MAGQVPIIILKEGTERTRGRDAQNTNIQAARVLADTVRTTLGPKGMDKLMVDSLGDVVITNDGATILDEVDVQQPAAKMLVQVAKTQDDAVGDGTTTAVILAGELLKKAETLLVKNVHPTVVVAGYKKAYDKAQKTLNDIALGMSRDDKTILKKIAMTSLNSKAVAGEKDLFAEIAVNSVTQVAEERDGKWIVDLDLVGITQKQGKSMSETEYIEGIIIDKERVHTRMPEEVSNAKIALVDTALEIEKTEFDSEIRISDPVQIQDFLDEEQRMLQEMVEKISNAGATVLFCQKGIDDVAQHYLSKAGILAVRRAKKSDMEKLAKATGAEIVSTLDELRADSLGNAGLVEEVKIGDDKMIFVRECAHPKAVSVLIRGGNKYMTDEAERALNDALNVVRDIFEDPRYVAGGGAPEIEVARKIRQYGGTVSGKEQLAIQAFADALETIPKTLAENAGMDPVDVLVDLRSQHDGGKLWAGVEVFTQKTDDMLTLNVVEPLRVKTHALKSATEAAEMILRIDDVIASKEGGGMPPGGMGGMPPGMGGMGGMPPGMGGMM